MTTMTAAAAATLINLGKGQKINLAKTDGTSLTNVCLGMNWGAIQHERKTGGFLGIGGSTVIETEAVDLDASCAVYDEAGKVLEVISFRNLRSRDGWIKHSGDDRVGDTDGNDGQDNETISVDLTKAPSSAHQVVFFLNSFRGHDFASIPYATIRIYEGEVRPIINEQSEVIAKYDVANESHYAGHVSMVMGRLYRRNGGWNFVSIGEATRDRALDETVRTIQNKFLAG